MRYARILLLTFLFANTSIAFALPPPPFTQCPPVGADASCAILLVVDSNGSLRVATDPSQGPYDQIEDTLIGVQNNSTKTVVSIPLKGAVPIFAFEADGICGTNPNTGLPFNPAPPGCSFGPTGYEGPGVSFSNISADATSGTVNFAGGIPPGGSAYFSLEQRISTLCQALTGVPLIKQYAAPWATDTYDHIYTTANYANAVTVPVSTNGTLQLVVYPIGSGQPAGVGATTHLVTLTATTNTLNGLRDAINALGANVTASVASTVSGAAYLSLAADNTVSSIELRQTVDDATSNILINIGRKGCWLTASAMVVDYQAAQQGISLNVDPRELNNYLNDQPYGYVGSDVNPIEVVKFAKQHGVNLSYDGRSNKRDDFTLDSYVCRGNPVMLKVGNPHFVVATGQTTVNGTDTYNINDPGHAATTLEPYNFTYSGLRLFSTSATPPSALFVVAHSPVELLVTDPSGRRTGLDPANNIEYQDIPASSYGVDSIEDDVDPLTSGPTPETKSFEALTPMAGTYTVDVIGTGSGPYTLDFLAYDTAYALTSTTLAGTALPGVTGRYKVVYSSVLGSQIQVTQVDTIPPVTTISASPVANANGWNNSDVALSLVATENEPNASGVKEIHVALAGAQTSTAVVLGSSASVTVSAEGTTTVSYFAVDNAGNIEATKTITLNIDKTPPTISGLPLSCILRPQDDGLIQVATVTATDNLSGVASFNVQVTSNISSEESQEDISVIGSGLQPRVIQLRAEPSDGERRRKYFITATASDKAGNNATVTTTCTVRHEEED